jgi:hypothetical protein
MKLDSKLEWPDCARAHSHLARIVDGCWNPVSGRLCSASVSGTIGIIVRIWELVKTDTGFKLHEHPVTHTYPDRYDAEPMARVNVACMGGEFAIFPQSTKNTRHSWLLYSFPGRYKLTWDRFIRDVHGYIQPGDETSLVSIPGTESVELRAMGFDRVMWKDIYTLRAGSVLSPSLK